MRSPELSGGSLPDSNQPSLFSPQHLRADLTAGIVVFLVALPLCLGIAVASGAPPIAGLLAGIIGGIVVGSLSGSHTSVSGPAAGLFAIVATQIDVLNGFEAFLVAVIVAGVIQIVMGIARAGELSSFFPSSVIKGLLAAIGIILILKQIPHVVGHDDDPEGDMSFSQPTDDHNTFSEIGTLFQGEFHYGAAIVGILSIAILVLWNRSSKLKNSPVPGPLVVVILGIVLQYLFDRFSNSEFLQIDPTHLVNVPTGAILTQPDFTVWTDARVYFAGLTIAIVASLETLLNLEAVDKLDPDRRVSPPSRELIAQGVGNVIAGFVGALPMTSVIVRSSVYISSRAKTKRSAVFHGILLLTFVLAFPGILNRIPLAALGGILLVTGFKLASPKLFVQMWNQGYQQFLPFVITVVAIVQTDLLIGILIGLAVSLLFILYSSLKRPVHRVIETHLDGDIMHVELANQVTFLQRAALDKLFKQTKPGTRLLIDATDSHFVDPDILSLITDFKSDFAPARNIKVSLRGFRDDYKTDDSVQFADYSTRELQDKASPEQVLEILKECNKRFQSGKRLTRDFARQVDATAGSQNPLAVVLSCIDSRVPAELVLDLGIGDIFSVRVAGNVIGTKSLGSMEYGVSVAGVKLILVMRHSRCGAVTSSVQKFSTSNVDSAGISSHLNAIVDEVTHSLSSDEQNSIDSLNDSELENLIDDVARRNGLRTVGEILNRSETIRERVDKGQVIIVGAMYDVKTGKIDFFN